MGLTGHLSVWRGKRVRVFLKDGTNKVLRFKARKSRTVEFFDHVPIKTSEIRTLTIFKGDS